MPQNMKHCRCFATIGKSQPLSSVVSRRMSVSLAISGPMVGVVIVLEAGYNHKAPLSGAMAHLTAVTSLVDGGDTAAKDNSPRVN